MSYCGENLTKDNMPSDAIDQLADILLALQTQGVSHNDIKPTELCVLDGKIRLLDLEWASSPGNPPPAGANGPKDIGGKFRSPAGYYDAYSLLKSLNAIETQS